ncbi:DUF1206 domain-containing protein [Aestuariibius sp. 2305UL40-4]|uniref:DUF1206 domain-containing protein n=1 Tax=Aestuariibius violaceus TaxID=3234132 RepID=UPI00345E0DD5
MQDRDFGWAIPMMQAGYAGRGLVYLAVAGISLYTIWQGGEAQGTSAALAQLEQSAWGTAALIAIGIGLLAYMLWRVVCGLYDLEDEGTGAKAAIARTGQIVTGLIHGALGFAVFAIMLSAASSGGGSKIAEFTGQVMSLPAGIWIVGIAGAITVGAGLYYLKKAYKEEYREKLEANHFTRNWNLALKAGVAAQGVTVTIIGVFLVVAALQADPSQAGGLDRAFSWLSGQIYGQILVTILCVGLAGFSLFCFVNAAYRIVPKAAGDDIQSLASKAKAHAQSA